MKKIIVGAFALSLFVVSCKKETKTESSVGKDTLVTATTDDSIPTPTASPSVDTENIITENVGKYPNEIKLFEDKSLTDRLKKLVGTQYDEMVKFFNVETPIVSENGIYKLTGCKKHDCAGYATSIYYDSKNDNLNVSIDKDGTVSDFAEKGKITVSESLKSK